MSTAARRSHRGDEYQVAVAAYWAARLLSDDAIDSVRVDAVALPGAAELIQVDDVVIGYRDGSWRFIQAKKNQTNRTVWELTDPVLVKELRKATDQLEITPTGRVEFCSRTPFGDLDKLIEDGADYPDHTAFAAHAPATLKAPLARLAGIIERDEAATLALLRRIDIGPHHDLKGWEVQTCNLLQSRVTDPEATLNLIIRRVRAQQSGLKARGDALRRSDLINVLTERGVFLLSKGTVDDDAQAFSDASRIGRQWQRTIGGEAIPRTELQQLIDWAGAPETVNILLTDGPGTGKSCVLLDFADRVEQQTNWSLLFIKGDLFARCTTAEDLAAAGLPGDLVPRAARLSRQRRLVVVIDSLDVLSLHREHRSLRLFLSLLDRLRQLPNLCLVTACRTFDLRYDPLLREQQWDKTLTLGPLEFNAVVAPFLARRGIICDGFSAELQALLEVPENLRLLVESAAGGASQANIRSLTSAYQLQALYLEEVVRRDPLLGDPAMDALQALASRMMQERSLRLPKSAVPVDEQRLRRLISQGVLTAPTDVMSGQAIGLAHQILLDALAVRGALTAGQTLADFILDHPPFPFLRPAVRGFATHLRATDPATFRRQLRGALGSPGVAYHLKRVLIESLAEMVPTDEDWPLIRHLWHRHEDLFRRLLWQIRHVEWFVMLREHWWPSLNDDSKDDPLRSDFIHRLDRWMNASPVQVLALWQQALDSDWGARLNLAWNIEIQLDNFQHWDTPGLEALIEALDTRPAQQYDHLGKVLSRFVDTTGRGEDRLWRHICRDVDLEDAFRPWRGLHCSPHDFHREDFLVSHLCRSDSFLSLIIGMIDSWNEQARQLRTRNGLDFGLLSHTTWEQIHSKQDMYRAEGIEFLMKALSEALRRYARERTDWWQRNELRLRTHHDLGVRYLLLLAYREDLEGNLQGISTQLLDEELHRNNRLSYELGEMANASYPFLTPETQGRHQTLILDSYEAPGDKAEALWRVEPVHRALLAIPAPFRSPSSQAWIDRWQAQLGTVRETPRLYSRGGVVAPPVASPRILSLSDEAVRRLLHFYTANESGWSARENDGLVGGRQELTGQLADAAACAPDRFLDLIPQLAAEDCHASFLLAIFEGAATHLRYRFGNLRPSNGKWEPQEPVPDGPVLSERLIGFVERYRAIWQDERTAARVLEGCADGVDGPDDIDRLVWLLVRLGRAVEPACVRTRYNTDTRTDVEMRDLTIDAINEPRGIAATTATQVAGHLAETGEAWPELLEPLLRRLASDPVASVRAALLMHLPFLHYQRPDLGWKLLDLCMLDPHPALWELAGKTLYYQLRDHFNQVRPYLDRMHSEAPGLSDETWSRLSTLALLEGHVSEDNLFHELQSSDSPKLWEGAVSVFSANIDEARLATVCYTGLKRILDCAQIEDLTTALDHRLMHRIGSDPAAIDLVNRFINRIDTNPKRHDFIGLPEWLAKTARRDPEAALPLLEKLAEKLEGFGRPSLLFHDKALIGAMLEVLREADDSDDPALVSRAIALQDRYLSLGLSGMEEMLEKSTLR